MHIYLLLTLLQLSLFPFSFHPTTLSRILNSLIQSPKNSYANIFAICQKLSGLQQISQAVTQVSGMNVDSDNFHQTRRHINEAQLIEKSKYICFDLEFTGVKFDNNEKDKYDMFPNEKYQKMASVASRFNIVQVGLTFLLEEPAQTKMQEPATNVTPIAKVEQESAKKYIAYPYNFYVIPRESYNNSPVISMQASCIEFNSAYNMDWNRWIRKGITYVRISQFNKHMQNMSASYLNATTTLTNSTCYHYNNVNGKLYGEILGELTQKVRVYVEDIVTKCAAKEVGFKYVIEVPKFSIGAIRRAVEAYAAQHSINFMLTKKVVVEHVDEQEEEKLGPDTVNLEIQIISEERKQQEQQKRRQQILGFSLIFQKIWNSGKTLVGHNCLYDLLFLYSAFVDELPKDYQNFKKILVDKEGRKFYDTKHMVSQMQIQQKIFKKGTSLSQLHKYYKQKSKNKDPIITLAPGFESYNVEQEGLHEAGIDSYLTASVFLNLPAHVDQGKLSMFKSYFTMNLHTPGDQIRKDMCVFVIAIVLNNAYVPSEQLRTMRMNQSKLIRDQLQKQNLMNDVIVIDGFKEIFLSMKVLSRNVELIRFLISLKKNKIVNSSNVMSLELWTKMRAEVATQIAAQGKNKN